MSTYKIAMIMPDGEQVVIRSKIPTMDLASKCAREIYDAYIQSADPQTYGALVAMGVFKEDDKCPK